jgi:type I restriction enzyme R subunit
MNTLPSYREELSSQIPAARLLVALGYHYLTPAEALALRGGNKREVVLTGVLEDWLRAHNHYTVKNETRPFNDGAIHEALRRVTRVDLQPGLVRANKDMFELLTGGFSHPQSINGDTRHFSLRFIDWEHPGNNVYHVTEEFTVERERSHNTRRPDLVCFVNGIPFAVIECKRPDLQSPNGGMPYEQAVEQMIGNQRVGEIRHLFVYSQLVLAVSANHAAYATTATEKKFWAVWREADEAQHDARVRALLDYPLPDGTREKMAAWRQNGAGLRQALTAAPGGQPSAQDRAIVSLLAPERLLELAYQFIVFDNGIKKIARYQQYEAVRAAVERVAGLNERGERTGGVIWHTTGSGKSLTMVMLAKALALHPAIRNPRVILVTDRVNLDRQIFTTFKHCGKQITQAASGRHLIELVRSGTDIIATVIDKFETVANEKVSDDNPNIFVLVDESHRSQYGQVHSKMRQVFPRGCYIGFTGTPLLKREKNTAGKFGGFIHKYSMRQAIEDKAVVPLLYEGRLVELEPNQAQLDRWFERHTHGLSDDQQVDLKRKMSRAEVVNDADRRIQEIAYDLSRHFNDHFKDGSGVKAQLATSSKQAALRYKKYLDECGLLTTAVVISGPDTREGHTDTQSGSLPEVQVFWAEMMERYGSEENYNREVVADFGDPEGVDLLIVVDKLLVGFDEPRNTVLYLDKNLRDHAILQAIARVNRLRDGKQFGVVVDYRGVLGELNEAIETYDALAEFDAEDLLDTIKDVSSEIEKLPQLHSDLWAVFNGVDTADRKEMELFLEPEDRRQVFYDALSAFAGALKIALSTVSFYENTPEERIRVYKRDLKKFHELRCSVKIRYAEAVDYRDYELKIRKLIDTHIDAQGVTVLTEEVDVFDKEAFDKAIEGLSSPRARAEAILNRLKRTAIEKMETDPAYYRKFSQMIDETLQKIRDGRLGELDALKQANHLRDEAISGERRDLPVELHSHKDAPAYYGVISEVLPEGRLLRERMVSMAIYVETAIDHLKVRDWDSNKDVQNEMKDEIEDYLYQVEKEDEIRFSDTELDQLLEQWIDLARKRDEHSF